MKGRRYYTVLVERDHIPPDANIRGLAVDAGGNVRVDVCQGCKAGMGLSGDQTMD